MFAIEYICFDYNATSGHKAIMFYPMHMPQAAKSFADFHQAEIKMAYSRNTGQRNFKQKLNLTLNI